MSDQEDSPKDQDKDRPDIEEVVSDFDNGIRVRSGFKITEQQSGVLGVNIFGPIFEFLDQHDDLEPDEESEDQENQE